MPACMRKIAAMASPTKRRSSSSKQNSAEKARVISVKRTDALPRKSTGSASRRKAVVQPPIDALTESLTKTTTSRTKTTRAGGRASGKLKRPVTALETVAETSGAVAPVVEAVATVELEVEASAIVDETTVVQAPVALPVEAVSLPSTAIEKVSPSAPHHPRRSLVSVVSRLLSALARWRGVRL
jgi:hypothetical protein